MVLIFVFVLRANKTSSQDCYQVFITLHGPCTRVSFFYYCSSTCQLVSLLTFPLFSRQEAEIEERLQRFATVVAPLYKKMAPEAYANQVQFERLAPECRLGLAPGRPFSGITACLDYCAHAHRDLHDVSDGCAVVWPWFFFINVVIVSNKNLVLLLVSSF